MRGELGNRRGEAEAPERAPAPCAKHVGRAHRPKIRDQPRERGEAHRHALDVGDRQGEAGAAQQVAGGAHVDLRMDMGRGFAAFGLLGGAHRASQARQAAGAGEGGEEQAVGPQRAPDQGQRAGQIVDAVEDADRDDKVEGAVGEGKAVLVALHAAGLGGEGGAGIGGGDADAPRAQQFRKVPLAAAEIEGVREGSRDRRQPLDQFVGGTTEEIAGAFALRRRPIAAQTAKGAVERLVLDCLRLHAAAYSSLTPATKSCYGGAPGGRTMPRPIHFEIHASDLDRAQLFYETLFGWRFQPWGNDDYRLIMTGGDGPGIDGGMMRRHGPAPAGGEPLTSWVCTVDVDDVDAYVERALAGGGSIAVPKMAIPGVGWLAYVKDGEGNILGMMQEDKGAS